MLADVGGGTAAQWERDVTAPDRVLLGAFADGSGDGDRGVDANPGVLVGVATAAVAVDDADVLLVVVDPAWRRRGLGAALTDALCTTLAAHGASRALLEVRAANTAALGLYARLGFTEVARRRSYYRDGEDAVVLARDLSALPGASTVQPTRRT